MRLHRLSVTAFGPFVETADVDFDVLSDAGLFLLSGATGAGKSSVLDAVCFALYGAIPGDRNHAGRLRSDQAPPDLAPRVELEATLSGRRFRVVRSPAWERPKKRGAGLTREPAKVTLSELRDDAWVPLSSRLDEAGDLISGLLGMNLDQFCQVALLPQGHFQAFLRADSAQRHLLLARLFRTGRFERVEAWLREHRLTLRRASVVHQAAVSDLVSRLCEAADVAAPDAVDDLPAAAGDGSLRGWATRLSRAAERAHATAVDLVASTTATAHEASERWERAREEERVRSRVREAATAQARLVAAEDDHLADLDRLEAGRRAEGLRPLARLVDDRVRRLSEAETHAEAGLAGLSAAGLDVDHLSDQLARIDRQVAELSLLLPAEQRLTALKNERTTCVARLTTLRRDAELADAERDTVAARLSRLGGEVEVAARAERSLPTAETEAVRLRAVASAHADAARFRAEVALATADHTASVGRLLDVRERLLDLRERRIAGMAAELAGALAVGDDCPVCGSADHPHKAQPATGHPDAATERAAQHDVDDAQALEHALALRVRDARSSLEAAERAGSAVAVDDLEPMLAAAERVLSETRARAARHEPLAAELAEAHDRARVLADESETRRVRCAELTTTLHHLEEQTDELEELVAAARGDHPALAAAVDELASRRRTVQAVCDAVAARSAARSALAEAEEALARAALEAGFHDVGSARRSELARDDLARLDEQVRAHRSALASAEAVLAEPDARRLLDAPTPDLTGLQAAQRTAATALARARAGEQVTARRHERVVGLTGELERALDGWTPVRDQLELASAVSAFAEGKAPDNRLQMRLSAYVLAYRLTQVVAAANARLAGMSDQRYSLEHVGQRGAGETRGGLSLVVRDDWSGESRDPATLSGGETFVVSLALALGLADVVAHEAGGADLATLFVDEGFGSLDAETLDDVLDILDTLRENGRAVGVVSHVAEMRDRIPTQLVVSKARGGSTVHITC